MTRRGWYILILAGMVALYAFVCLKFDKLGTTAPATLCGAPVWIVTAVGLGLLLLGGTQYRPVVDPSEYGETPGCVFQMFIGFFFLAMFLGISFTEPIICTGRDGDFCYEYESQQTYRGTRYDGSSYSYTYRNNWVWVTDATVDTTLSAGSFLADMDLDDSEAAIFIVIVIVLLILVLSSAFIPNMWVLACALCIGATYLTILRLSNEEKQGKRKPDGTLPPDLSKPKNEDPLLADPVILNSDAYPETDKPKNGDYVSALDTTSAPVSGFSPDTDRPYPNVLTPRSDNPLLSDPAEPISEDYPEWERPKNDDSTLGDLISPFRDMSSDPDKPGNDDAPSITR